MLSAILLAALSLWAVWFPVPDITVIDESLNPAYAGVYVAAWAAIWPHGCTISVGQTWALYTAADKLSIMAHEVGHCLGLDHDCDVYTQSLMCQPQIGGPQDADRFALIREHGFKTRISAVGYD